MTCGLSHDERRARLIEEHGKPVPVDRAAALRMAGLRDTVHPNDAAAFLYRDQAAADAYDTSNREHYDTAGHAHHGIPRLATLTTDAGILGILDLRNSLVALGGHVTDPAMPDRWPPRPEVTGDR